MTATRWFRLPETTTELGKRPDFLGFRDKIRSWKHEKKHPDGAPIYVVYVEANSWSVLDDLGDEPQATPLENVPTQALNDMRSATGERTRKEWTDIFEFNR